MIQTNKLLFLFLFISVNAFAQSYSSYNFEKLVADEQRAHRYINNTMLSLAGNNYDVKYNRCEWTIDPAVYYIKGGVTTYFSSNISSLNQIKFDLSKTKKKKTKKKQKNTQKTTKKMWEVLDVDVE